MWLCMWRFVKQIELKSEDLPRVREMECGNDVGASEE
ncbi:predicted protein [Sclerotinia sclerotiorum 1980 UF-70]|uniref:Uncharacterized protein n=1 Tax=Sclerotinia sclerotiorum (strain ATCC 18683 / 1980 / Ss-1) TaxID=665079 RepID=A7EKP9_SCLS1|nr:predicted protein [Sclerotinia sclerotiorum 1980 UF-70]EDO03415.1 predicted protein [Sclerotinia sclerotiorum 1980 UF-70]